jgi:thiamine pyrophosphate-dependent acetolactate synthase large subunit-like protein
MKVCEAVARAVALECPGAPVFSLIGDANLPIVGAIDRYTNLLQSFARDEGAAVAMADGYAQATGGLGVATVTSGPGLTHAATSLLGASRVDTPIVVVAGDTPMRRPSGIQEMQSFDQRRFVEACEAQFQGLRSPLSVAEDIASAFYRARKGRGPLVLSVPLDLQNADVADNWNYEPSIAACEHLPLEPGAAALSKVVDILKSAQRPLILAGRGAWRSGARDDLQRLGEQIGALLGTTLLARGLFDADPWNIGVVGGFSSPAAMDLIRNADVIVAFGAELGHFTTQAGSLLRDRRVVRVDVAPFAKMMPLADVFNLQADARAAAAALCLALQGAPRTGFRTAATRAKLSAPIRTDGPAIGDNLIDPRRLMADIGPTLAGDTQVVVGGGHFWSFPCLYLKQPAHGSFFCPLGAAAVGQALPFGIGVAMGSRPRPVMVIEGDGSLLMNIQELDTAARHGLPIVLVTMNDGALTAEALKLRAQNYDESLAVYPSPDFAAIARGFGWKAVTIDNTNDVSTILTQHIWSEGPLLIDARISREIVVDPVSVKNLGRHD